MEEGTVDLGGRWRAAPADEPTRRRSADPDLDDADWEPLGVPGHWRTTPAFADLDEPLLTRRRFLTPELADGHPLADHAANGGLRWWLALDGVFASSDVWLDGGYVGDTEGWFVPHRFDVTEALAARREHLVSLEVACPAAGSTAAGRALLGAFGDPAVVGGGWNPGGIWRPVRLQPTGPVSVRHLRVRCIDATAAGATVAVRAVLDATSATDAVVRTGLSGPGPGAEIAETHHLAAGENRLEWTVRAGEPRLWWPWSLGDQPLYDVDVTIEVGGSGPSDHARRRIGLRRVRVARGRRSVNGDAMFVRGVAALPVSAAPGALDAASAAADVHEARALGADLLRLHAHVARPELYDAADEAGILIEQELPLAGPVPASARRQARRQARELVDLLAHRPSVASWVVRPPTPVGPTPGHDARPLLGLVGGTVRASMPSWGEAALDRPVARVLRRVDGTRPVVVHGGAPPSLGDRRRPDTDLRGLVAVTDGSRLADEVRRWPELSRYVGVLGVAATTGADEDADGWLAARRLRRDLEHLRRCRFRPAAGVVQWVLADRAAHTGWGLRRGDGSERPVAAAVSAAYRPTLVVADPLPTRVAPGDRIETTVHVVNDATIAYPDSVVVCQLIFRSLGRVGSPDAEAARRELAPPSRPARDAEAPTWRWKGELPARECVRVGHLGWTLPEPTGEAPLAVELDLWWWAAPEGAADPAATATNRYVAIVDPVPAAR